MSWHPAPADLRSRITFHDAPEEVNALTIHWQHEATYLQQKGRVKVSCKCGWQSPKCDDYAAARKLYDEHVGLAYKKARKEQDE